MVIYKSTRAIKSLSPVGCYANDTVYVLHLTFYANFGHCLACWHGMAGSVSDERVRGTVMSCADTLNNNHYKRSNISASISKKQNIIYHQKLASVKCTAPLTMTECLGNKL